MVPAGVVLSRLVYLVIDSMRWAKNRDGLSLEPWVTALT